jgi:hypothetical protein
MMRKSKLIDMLGLSGNPSDEDQLEALLFRLEAGVPAAQNAVTVMFEPDQLRGPWEITPGRIILS